MKQTEMENVKQSQDQLAACDVATGKSTCTTDTNSVAIVTERKLQQPYLSPILTPLLPSFPPLPLRHGSVSAAALGTQCQPDSRRAPQCRNCSQTWIWGGKHLYSVEGYPGRTARDSCRKMGGWLLRKHLQKRNILITRPYRRTINLKNSSKHSGLST